MLNEDCGEIIDFFFMLKLLSLSCFKRLLPPY